MFKAIADFFFAKKELNKFKALPRSQRQLVFYSEGKGYWTFFQPIYQALQEDHQQEVLYVTSAKDDPIYTHPPKGIQAFYIGSGTVRTLFFATLNADVLLMTMPDLQTFHIKRSPHPVKYVYVQHSLVSKHLAYRPAAFDHFDAVLCAGEYQIAEIRAREKLHQLPAKDLVKHGYSRLDVMLAAVNKGEAAPLSENLQVLLAPTWGEVGLLKSHGEQIISQLLASNIKVLLRPHPRTSQLQPEVVQGLVNKFAANPLFSLDTNIDSFTSLAQSHLLISDWSGAAIEYAFCFKRPVIFIDAPKKLQNPDYQELGLEPIEISHRNKLGKIVALNELDNLGQLAKEMHQDANSWQTNLTQLAEQTVFNLNTSGKQGANYLMKQLEKS